MKRTAAALALLAVSHAVPARAELPKFELPRLGIFRKKKEDPPPQPPAKQPTEPTAEKGSSVTDVLKSDLDEKHRLAAAEALRGVDTRTSPDAMPALLTSLQQDPSARVRAAVAETIGGLKPVSAEAAALLETAVASDPSDAVRKASQQALWQYHLNGYRSVAAGVSQTAEPPLAKPKTVAPRPPAPGVLTSKTPAATVAPVATPPAPRPITTGIGKGAIYPQTIEPPLAKPKTPVSVVKPEPKAEVKPVVKPEPKAEVKPEPKVEVTPPVPAVEVPPIAIPLPMPEKKPEPAAPTLPPSPTGIPVPPPSSVPTIPPPGN